MKRVNKRRLELHAVTKRLQQIASAVGVYDKVIWNKSKTAFIGYSYIYPYSYLYNRDYVYIKGNTIIIFNNIIEE